MKQYSDHHDEAAIAVVGMAGRFPGAADLQQFWQNLCDGQESIRPLTADEQARYQRMTGAVSSAGMVQVASLIDDVDGFDHQFFGISATEAQLMSPQHRLLLETAYQALEHAGLLDARARQGTGVYCAVNLSDYLINNIAAAKHSFTAADRLQIEIGSDQCYASSLIAHKLNLHGPCLSVNTACSSSLVAVHLACRALLSYECDSALAGAANVYVSQLTGYQYQEGGVQAKDGHCRPFDAAANGTVFGSGAGVLVLKRLEDALADQDCIWAVIRGSAINNDGDRKVGFTAPSVNGQAEVICSALGFAGLTPDDISYIEAHGTGTPLGDPIEIAALELALGQASGSCRIGSVKSNIGHLNCAAGIAGALKTILMLHHQMLVPTLHYQQPNPQIDFSNSRFRVQSQAERWVVDDDKPRIAGVSSFGIGGTNAHVLFEEFVYDSVAGSAAPQLIRLTAKDETALAADAQALQHWLLRAGEVSLDTVAAKLARRDLTLPHRLALYVDSTAQLSSALADISQCSAVVTAQPALVLMFAGQGTTLPPALCALAIHEPVFRQQIEQVAGLLASSCGVDVWHILQTGQLPPDTARQQPLLFSLQVLWVQYLLGQGIRPAALLGQSLGEYAAACVAGVFTLEQGITLVSQRGRLMQSMPAGRMLAAALTPEAARQYCDDQIELGLSNGPEQVVFTGPVQAIEQLAVQLAAAQVQSKMLQTSHAFHSRLLEPMLAEYAQVLQQVNWQPPQLPFLSNVSGDWITSAQATDPAYWLAQLRQPVRCADNFARLTDSHILLEAGGVGAMSQLARLNGIDPRRILRQPLQTAADVMALHAALWCRGFAAGSALPAVAAHRPCLLPGRRFTRHRHWIEPVSVTTPAVVTPTNTGQQQPQLYAQGWQSTLAATQGRLLEPQRFIVLTDAAQAAQPLLQALSAAGHQVSMSVITWQSEQHDDQILSAALQQEQRGSCHLVLVLSAALAQALQQELPERWCYPLLWLCQRMAARPVTCRVTVVSENYLSAVGLPAVAAAAMLTGQLYSIRHELPKLQLRQIDAGDLHADADALAAQLTRESNASVMLYRGGSWWQRYDELVPWQPVDGELSASAPYLLTGGLGDVGFQLALAMAELGARHLIIPGRRPLPDRANWPVFRQAPSSIECRMIERVAQLEALGVRVDCPWVDLSAQPVSEWLTPLERLHGPIAGVVHAAGIAQAGLVIHSDLADARAQFALKVELTAQLFDYFATRPLSFFCLISSAIASSGAIGQSFYSAANAYMDQLASSSSQRVLSIGWAGWQQLGLGSERSQSLLLTSIPVLRQWHGDASKGWQLTAVLDPATHWLLHEHRIKQVPVLPATGYLSILSQCCARMLGADVDWELADLSFVNLLYSRAEQPVTVLISFVPATDGYEICISQATDRRTLITGRLVCHRSDRLQPVVYPAGPWQRQLQYADRLPALDASMTLGPRWHCLQQAQINPDEALLSLQLDQRFVKDLEIFPLHPALLDVGLGVAISDCLLQQQAVLPVGLGRFVQFAALTAQLFCYVRCKPRDAAEADLVILDVDFYSPDCRPLASIRDYRLKRQPATRAGHAPVHALPDHDLLRPVLPAELGRQWFRQILCSPVRGHVVIDSIAPRQRELQWQQLAEQLFGQHDAATSATALQDSSIAVVRQVMKQMLGAETLTDSTDFFAAGGHSLLASRILSQYRQQLGVSAGIDMMFELPTVRGQAALLDAMLRSRGVLQLPPQRNSTTGYVEGVV